MANSARDPYWQASVRREDIDHPEARAEIEDAARTATCRWLVTRRSLQGRPGEVFAHLPFDRDPKKMRPAEDGVSCSLCHQIGKEKLGTRESFNGGFVMIHHAKRVITRNTGLSQFKPVRPTSCRHRPRIRPVEAAQHIRDSAMCATCHTLYTKS